MTYRFSDGFDSYSSNTQYPIKWTTATSAAFGSTAGRFGGGALYNSGTNPYATNATKNISIPSGAKARIGFHIKYTAGAVPSGIQSTYFLVGFNASTAMTLNTLGQVIVTALGATTALITSSVTINDGNFHWLELEYYLNGASGTAQLYIDGVSQGSYTGSLGAAAAINSFTVGFAYVFANTGWIDDVIVWDDQGSTFNTFPLGPRRISTLVPNADGDLSQFTPKSGTAHYAMVNGGYGSTNYVSDTGTGNVDLYKFPSLAYSPTSVNAVVAYYYGQNTGSGSTNLIPKVKTSGTTASGSTLTLSVGTNTLLQSVFTTDAGGAAWTASAVNAMQIGMGD